MHIQDTHKNIQIRRCYRCGNSQHLVNVCEMINVVCSYYNRKRHIQKVRTKARISAANNAHQMEETQVEEIIALETEHAEFREKFLTNLTINNRN